MPYASTKAFAGASEPTFAQFARILPKDKISESTNSDQIKLKEAAG